MIALAGAVFAHVSGDEDADRDMMEGGMMRGIGNYDHGMHDDEVRYGYMHEMHEEMEDAIESGDYDRLVELRDKYDMPMMPWIKNSDDMKGLEDMHREHERRRLHGCH